MNIAFRVDASTLIGTGHFMRCLSLAITLKPFSSNISFVCRHLPEYLQKMLADNECHFIHIDSPQDIGMSEDNVHSHWLGVSQKQDAYETKQVLSVDQWDWLVVDHYALDIQWESALRNCIEKILVIDDLADRRHDCDVLLDQNIYVDMDTRYGDKVSSKCILFLGLKYVILRDEFCKIHKKVKVRSGKIKNILIYFGGFDLNNDTTGAVRALINSGVKNLKVNVVIGMQHPFLQEIELLCKENGFICHINTDKMAALMCKADFAIGAGGISTYERLYMRLPAILKPISLNQTEPLLYMSEMGFFEIFFTQQELEEKLKRILKRNNTSPIDCVEDGSKKIVAKIVKGYTFLRTPRPLEIRRTFKWLQNEHLRKDFMVIEKPVRVNHFKYWRLLIKASDQKVCSIVHSGKHVGNCGLKNIDQEEKKCELWIYLAAPSIRGRGVAKSSVKTLLSIAKIKYDCVSVYIHVARTNKAAIHLYEKSGFKTSNKALTDRWLGQDSEILYMECLL
jgi:UDP-2,4-diacetamido-2,4,6-trideoxy-beta-L-altropyranose hydrolase